MELTKFLSLCGMLVGFVAAVFLSKVLFSGAEEILRATYHYSPIGWPSVDILAERVGHKADVLSSVILVFVALFLQVASLFVRDSVMFCGKRIVDTLLIATVFVCVVSVIAAYIGRGYQRVFEQQIKELIALDRLKYYVEESSVPLYQDVKALADQYFALKPKPDEQNAAFLKRFADHLGYKLPDKANFEKFR